MILVIQTNVTGRLAVWLIKKDDRVASQKRRVQWHGSERLLPLIDQILQANRAHVKDIRRIAVVRGPGPFTAVRSGLIAGNTLGWLLNIPVQGVVAREVLSTTQVLRLAHRNISSKFQPIKPFYGRQPNITRPTKRI